MHNLQVRQTFASDAAEAGAHLLAVRLSGSVLKAVRLMPQGRLPMLHVIIPPSLEPGEPS